MTLTALANAYERHGAGRGVVRRVWKLVAFLGRYGHQPAESVLDMTTTDLQRLADSVAEILKEEGDAMRSATDG